MSGSPEQLDERGLPAGYALRPGWEVGPRELQGMLERGEDVVLLDVRTPQEFAVTRIEGTELVPLQQLPMRLGELGDLAGRRVVTVCHHGMRSLQAAAFLRQQGFEDVRSLAGGIDLWSRAVDQSVPRY